MSELPFKRAIILGSNSDIGLELINHLLSDKDTRWAVSSVHRGNINADPENTPHFKWDLLICCIGVLTPIGNFFETNENEWESNIDSNTLLPLRLLRKHWKYHNPDASVCFFSGAGTSNSAKTYSAYSSSKMMLFKMTELLDDENPDVKFFILGPGMVRTKIQKQTLDAGERADNFIRVKKFMDEGDALHKNGTSHDRIYDCLKWCMSLPKNVIGGRNIYVPDAFGPELEEKLKSNQRYYKLRRHE